MGRKEEMIESGERHVRSICRATRRKYSTEDRIGIVLSGLRGEHSITELCCRENIAQSLYSSWSKEFLEAGKKRLAGDADRQASSGDVKQGALPRLMKQSTTTNASREPCANHAQNGAIGGEGGANLAPKKQCADKVLRASMHRPAIAGRRFALSCFSSVSVNRCNPKPRNKPHLRPKIERFRIF